MTDPSMADYIADNYGICDRGAGCYHGKDARGHQNGCLQTGWKGRGCPHWQPVVAANFDELRESLLAL